MLLALFEGASPRFDASSQFLIRIPGYLDAETQRAACRGATAGRDANYLVRLADSKRCGQSTARHKGVRGGLARLRHECDLAIEALKASHADAGRRRNQVQVELELQARAGDLHVQQAQEAASEAETQRHRRFPARRSKPPRLIPCGVRNAVAQMLVLGTMYGTGQPRGQLSALTLSIMICAMSTAVALVTDGSLQRPARFIEEVDLDLDEAIALAHRWPVLLESIAYPSWAIRTRSKRFPREQKGQLVRS